MARKKKKGKSRGGGDKRAALGAAASSVASKSKAAGEKVLSSVVASDAPPPPPPGDKAAAALRIVVLEASNLPLRSKSGTLSKATFKVCAHLAASFTTGGDEGPPPPSSSRRWEGTNDAKAEPGNSGSDLGRCAWANNAEVRLELDAGSEIEDLDPETPLDVALRRDYGKLHPSHEVGRVRTTLRKLAADDVVGLEVPIGGDGAGGASAGSVLGPAGGGPKAIVRVSVVRDCLPAELRIDREPAAEEVVATTTPAPSSTAPEKEDPPPAQIKEDAEASEPVPSADLPPPAAEEDVEPVPTIDPAPTAASSDVQDSEEGGVESETAAAAPQDGEELATATETVDESDSADVSTTAPVVERGVPNADARVDADADANGAPATDVSQPAAVKAEDPPARKDSEKDEEAANEVAPADLEDPQQEARVDADASMTPATDVLQPVAEALKAEELPATKDPEEDEEAAKAEMAQEDLVDPQQEATSGAPPDDPAEKRADPPTPAPQPTGDAKELKEESVCSPLPEATSDAGAKEGGGEVKAKAKAGSSATKRVASGTSTDDGVAVEAPQVKEEANAEETKQSRKVKVKKKGRGGRLGFFARMWPFGKGNRWRSLNPCLKMIEAEKPV